MRSRILFAICFISVAVGQPSFTAADIATSADGASSLYAVDLDNDGDIDVISNAMYENKVYWFENNGASDPSFSTNTLASTTSAPGGIYAVDVDGDGDIDLSLIHI